MTQLWTALDLLEATGGAIDIPFGADGVSIDTRSIRPGDLFVALLGEGRDGHVFVAEALAKGAAGAMVHRAVPYARNLLRVDDTLAALARMGGFARVRTKAKVVAVTGSVGKTTTKEMLRTILSHFGTAHAAESSYNNHWGLPLTLVRMPRDAAFCIAEIGMNHAGEIAPLAHLAQPHVAVITTVEKAHIGYLGSIEAIADEKAAIMTGLVTGGLAVLPRDSPYFPRLRAAAGDTVMATFGTSQDATIRLMDIEADSEGSNILAEIDGQEVRFRLNAPGQHMAMNAFAALTVAHVLGLDRHAAALALAQFVPLSGRGARRKLVLPAGTVLLLDESYNANAASVRAALDVLRLQPARRRIAVLGDMLELGDAGPSEHAGLAAAVVGSADVLFACGPLMRNLFQAVPAALRGAHAEDSAALAPIVAQAAMAGDAILVKGSLGSSMKRVVDALDALTPVPEGAA